MVRARWLLTSVVTALLLCLLLASPNGTANRRASAHAPHTALDFSMGADVNADGIDDCSTRAGQPTTCVAPENGPFAVNEYLDSMGDIPAFRDLQLHFGYDGAVQPDGDPQMTWPGCVGAGITPFPGYTHVACTIASTLSYLGPVGNGAFVCTGDGSLNLMHGVMPYHTYISDPDGMRHAEDQQTMEMLDVQCLPPAAYPTDSDGDGCPDTREAASDLLAGGLRNFFNPWDYFNPTGDGKNRVDDILSVVQHYGSDTGQPAYNARYDRTVLGPNTWNLGPPDGKIRVIDISAAAKQYAHDCS